MHHVKQSNKLDVLNTLKLYTPRLDLYFKYRKEEKDRAKRASRDARLVKLLTK